MTTVGGRQGIWMRNTTEKFRDTLNDCGFSEEKKTQYMELMKAGRKEGQLRLLKEKRRASLDELHRLQREIDCIDYVMDQVRESR